MKTLIVKACDLVLGDVLLLSNIKYEITKLESNFVSGKLFLCLCLSGKNHVYGTEFKWHEKVIIMDRKLLVLK
jgi:hypothetical protein